MRIRDLGPLLVEVDGRVTELGVTKQAALLAALVIHVNQQVSASALIAAAWGSDAEVSLPRLDSQLWRLRNVLEPGRGRSSAVLVREGDGYRLVVDPEEIDSGRLERLVVGVGSAFAARDPATALRLIEEALALWRGSPYESLTDDADHAPAIARLEEVRSQLQERRIEALLDLGVNEQALADLQPLLARTPFRENLWQQHMVALVRLGRVEEALAAYAQIRALLADELGLDPGPELLELHARILARDTTLVPRRQVVDQPPGRGTVQLPQRWTPLIGRETDLDRLSALVLDQPVVTICGPGGSGKTRLAVEVAAAVSPRFPDGTWFVDLTAATDSRLVIDVLVSTLALGASQVVDPLRALADFARDRRMLVVLDNCEHVLDGVAPVVDQLLGGVPGSTPDRRPVVLATSREPLDVDGEHIWTLAPLSLLADDTSDDGSAPALRLFVQRARAANPGLVLDTEQLALAESICRALDGLPLAIELAAARVRSFNLAEIAEQARADPSRLSRLGRRPAGHRQSLYEAIEWSYRLLSPPEQSLHRSLSVLPGPFTLAAARGVADRGRENDYEVADGLLGLAHRSLLTVSAPAGRQAVSTFAQLETVRAHAHRRLVGEGESDELLDRRDRWVTSLLAKRPRLGRPEAPGWYDELEGAYPAIRAALQRAATPGGDPELVSLGSSLGFFWYFRSRMIEGCRWLEKAHAAQLLAPGTVAEVVLRLRLSGAFLLRFRPDVARRHLPDLDRLAETPPESAVLMAEALVSAAGGAWACRAFDLVTVLSSALTRLAARTADDHVELFADMIACVASLPLGRVAETGARAEQLYARSVEIENLIGGWVTALIRCVVATETLNPTDALAWTQRVVDLHRRLGSGGSKVFLETLANCYAMTEDFDSAVRIYSATRVQARQAGSGWPEHPMTRELFGRSRARLEPAAFDRAWRAGEQLSMDNLAEWVGPASA